MGIYGSYACLDTIKCEDQMVLADSQCEVELLRPPGL